MEERRGRGRRITLNKTVDERYNNDDCCMIVFFVIQFSYKHFL